MKWNAEEVCRILNARFEDEGPPDNINPLVQFEDKLMRYEMRIFKANVFLAADPERPIQGLPFFEISVPCTELAPVPRSGMPIGIGMFLGPVGAATLCFSITRREDGCVSLSGAWDGLGAAYRLATQGT